LLCGKSFVWSNKANKRRQESTWFHKWIKEGYSVRQLSSISGYHPDKLRDIIHANLVLSAPVCTDFAECHHLLCDGTFIEGRKHGLFVVMGAGSNKVVAGKYDVKEKQSDLIQYFGDLKTQGMNPLSFTTDGSPAILKALRTVWPSVVIQRCMVHIQRQGLMWCRAKPKRIEAVKLRLLFLQVTDIRSKKTAEEFLQAFMAWDNQYGQRLFLGNTTGWVVSDLIRARSMLLNALPNMFHSLVNPNIPNTTNALEGYFSRLKAKYRQHRGLSSNKRNDYFKWYLSSVSR
jgi:hypothetical protein